MRDSDSRHPHGSLTIAGDSEGEEAVYFKAAEVRRIIANSREPYRTMFVLAAVTDLRAGELLGLTVEISTSND